MKPIVYIDELKQDKKNFENQLRDAVVAIGLYRRVKEANKILIKPNLTFPFYKEGVTTRVSFVATLIEVLLECNNNVQIFIGEGEGGYNSFSMSKAMETMGFNDICRQNSNVHLVNLSKIGTNLVTLETHRGKYSLDLPSIFFDQVDFSISCPLAKVHAMTRVTLSLKNLWGCLPDTMRLKNHFMLPHILPIVSKLLKFEFAFLDGKFGLNSNGPMEGNPVELNWFVASNSLGAFDATVADMMGFKWTDVPHLKIAGEQIDQKMSE